MSNGQDVKDSVNSLMEEFTEMEADLPEDVYKALAPHIKKVSDGLHGAFENLNRLNRISELITILSSGRIDITDVDLEAFRRAIQSPRETELVIQFTVRGEEGPQEEGRLAPIYVSGVDYDTLRRHFNITEEEAAGVRLLIDNHRRRHIHQIVDVLTTRLVEYRQRQERLRRPQPVREFRIGGVNDIRGEPATPRGLHFAADGGRFNPAAFDEAVRILNNDD